MEGLNLILWILLWFGLAFGQERKSDIVTFPVREEQDKGFVIGSLITEAGLDRRYDMEQIAELRFKLIEAPADCSDCIMLEKETGVLKINRKVDREEICPLKERCFLQYDVMVHPVVYVQIIKVVVEIMDLNDNAPTFPEKEITLAISEVSIPGTTFSVPSAMDLDGGDYSVQGYALKESDSHMFNLQVKQIDEGQVDVGLMLIDHLDREQKDKYTLSIEAFDNGSPRRKNVLKVNIVVTDANDNDPVFDFASYEATVPENIPTGTTVVQVHATDRDDGPNGDILYSFTSQTRNDFGHIFDIDSQSGDVFIKGTLDYEEGSIYSLTVLAQDQGPGSLTSQTNVIIKVEDMNDQAPLVSVHILSKTGIAEVDEKAPINTFVALLMVSDTDTGSGGIFQCNISSEYFSMSPTTPAEYKITTKVVFDREQRSHYTFDVICADEGFPPRTSVTNIDVKIVDVNDHAPRFRPDIYTVHTIENMPLGTVIAQVNATDLDAGLNGRIMYRLHDSVHDLLSVDPDNGIITTNVVLDYEKQPKIDFIAYAQDKGDPPRSSSASVHLYIKDEDDEVPKFEQEKYTFYVLENQVPGAEVGSVKAHDADSYPNNQFVFSLEPYKSPRGIFRIHPNTGVITTLKILDREDRPVYHMNVLASSVGGTSRTSECNVVIHVKDINDNSPVFNFPVVGLNDTIFLSNQAVVGHELTKLHAEDSDEGANSKLMYRITGGNAGNYFSLDTSSGRLFVYEKLSDLADRLFVLKVQVSDQGEPQYSSDSVLYINVRSSIKFQPKQQPGSSLSTSSSAEVHFLASDTMTLILSCTAGMLLVLIALTVAIIICLRGKRHHDNSQSAADAKETQKMLGLPSPEKDEKGVELKQHNNGLSAVIDMQHHQIVANNHKSNDARPDNTLTKVKY